MIVRCLQWFRSESIGKARHVPLYLKFSIILESWKNREFVDLIRLCHDFLQTFSKRILEASHTKYEIVAISFTFWIFSSYTHEIWPR